MKAGRGCVILAGASFRDGGQGSSNVDTENSINWQKEASDTHLKFFKKLKNVNNIELDLAISTYNTEHIKKLIDWYSAEHQLLNVNMRKNYHGLTNLLRTSYSQLDIKEQMYDFVLCLRIDLILKDTFIEIFNPEWKEIRFPFAQAWSSQLEDNEFNFQKIGKFEPGYSYPHVCDTMVYIPIRFCKEEVQFNLVYNHRMWNQLISHHNFTYNELDVMVDTFHGPNSRNFQNPLYRMCGRDEQPNKNKTRGCYGEIFDKYKVPVGKFKDYHLYNK